MMEIMLDYADMCEPEPLRFLGEKQRLFKICGARLLLGHDIGKKLHTELHGVRSPAEDKLDQ
jgi:hypothetical protein